MPAEKRTKGTYNSAQNQETKVLLARDMSPYHVTHLSLPFFKRNFDHIFCLCCGGGVGSCTPAQRSSGHCSDLSSPSITWNQALNLHHRLSESVFPRRATLPAHRKLVFNEDKKLNHTDWLIPFPPRQGLVYHRLASNPLCYTAP